MTHEAAISKAKDIYAEAFLNNKILFEALLSGTVGEYTETELIDIFSARIEKLFSISDADLTEEQRETKAKIAPLFSEDVTSRDAKQITSVIAKAVKKLEYPRDKINNNIWNLLYDAENKGQMQLNLNVASAADKKSGNNALVFFGVSFDKLPNTKLNKVLTPFDKRIYIAISALWNAGNHVTTLSQIHNAAGYTNRPTSDELQKISDCIDKLRLTNVEIDNVTQPNAEVKLYPNQVKFKYKGCLLPCELIEATVNGKLTNGAIKIYREPPLTAWAKERKQIATLDKRLLQTPISKTEANILLEDILLERIITMTSSRAAKHIILFEYIYDKARITTASQRSRLPGKLDKILSHFKKCEYIKNFDIQKEGVTIDC